MCEVVGKVIVDEAQIRQRAKEIGAQITEEFKGEEVIIVGILKGAVVWMADLIKAVDLPVKLDFMVVSSYGASTKTSGIVKIVKDLDVDIEGKNVIIVEDIVDSGITLSYLKRYFESRLPKCVKICSLFDKLFGCKVELKADYVGFKVGNHFIIGYGLDYDQSYRNLPYITCLDEAEPAEVLLK